MKRIWMLVLLCGGAAWADTPLRFEAEPGGLRVLAGAQMVARYVYQDVGIHRPYFCALTTLEGTPVTRTHPPVEGIDPTDHAEFHPGLWLAFGDISGADNWRNKAYVRHQRFFREPKGGAGQGEFSVENVYLDADGRDLCREKARYAFSIQGDAWLLQWDSEFTVQQGEVVFGDQEEMGLGVRVATPMMVQNGGGIRNSRGDKNEAGVWGKTADWCAYQGTVDGKPAGVCLMPHPDTFRPSWFHARDYGLLVANAFGRNAFTQGEASRVAVTPQTPLRLRFGVLVYSKADSALDKAHAAYVQASRASATP